MGWLTKILGSDGMSKPIEALTGTLKAVDSMTTSEEEKAGLRRTVTLALIEAQATVLAAEVAHGSPLARSWRPILMLSFGAVIVWNYVAATLGMPAGAIPGDMWDLLKIAIGGYIGGRTVEKVARTVAPTYTARQLRKLAKAGVEVNAE